MKKIGELGEEIIAQYLINKGYEIIHQGWYCRWGEMDIIAQKKPSNILIFVEVKTRSIKNWDNDGIYAITQGKQKKLWLTAESFLSKNSTLATLNCRFDVALLTYQKNIENNRSINLIFEGSNIFYQGYKFKLVNYIENAF
ncbi:YraN family protein [Geminocystis sp. NIES-3709]|uniref:YraN family protein n=1 Tax=Geminocystis sp. NIES-3709 TaxID=1617448 RepID=UPI0005FC5787|nr:YraN family protein [Geminocystis sp. NIES-3709]BAQ64064.1 hypothetical protein GM3709_829 [Geminocystis sp. NIES-3709]